MLNREKYADKIIEIAASSKLALKDGKPTPCSRMRCSECGFHSINYSCSHKVYEWLDSEYVEPPVMWMRLWRSWRNIAKRWSSLSAVECCQI